MLTIILYTVGKNLDKLKLKLQCNFSILQKWFYENHIILNPGKCHHMLVGGHIKIDYISLNVIAIESSRNETLLRVILDKNLKFDAYIKCLRAKASTCEFCGKISIYPE